MNEKETLVKCVVNPGFATQRLIQKYGYSMTQLQKLRDRS
jgi:predicted cupin superfamily sugar epimerase